MLYQKYRPTNFNTLVGNEETKESIKALIEGGNSPHAFLITGPTGCGKTTIGRIIADKLGAEGQDYKEINSSDMRGIDFIRDLIQKSTYKPMKSGSCRVYLIDECFVSGTKVRTVLGSKNIEDIKIGESIFSVNGTSKVTDVFKNKVSIDRIVQLKFDDGTVLNTTKQHKFLTSNGWYEAQHLTPNELIFSFSSDIMHDIDKNKGESNVEDMRVVQGSVQSENEKTSNLQQELQSKSKKSQARLRQNNHSTLRMVQGSYKEKGIKPQEILQSELWGEMEYESQRNEGFAQIGGDGTKKKGILDRRKEKNTRKTVIYANEGKQSYAKPKDNRKIFSNKTKKWDSSCMERRKRGEWEINETPINTERKIRGGMGIGVSNKDKKEKGRQFPTSIQSGYSESKIEINNRGRWEVPHVEKEYITRCQENKNTKCVRLASIEIYERGNNDGSFESVISDKDKRRGYTEFYDLEIEGHASYFANNIPVHNCHNLTKDAQNAILKLLEDPPKHAYFILATTDPQKLLPAIKGRCVHFAVTQPSDDEMLKLLKRINKKEKLKIDEDTLYKIIDKTNNHPRNAIQLLEQLAALDEEKRDKFLKQAEELELESMELCRVITRANSSWGDIQKVLNALKTHEPESLRRQILGYCQAILLKQNKPYIVEVMSCFLEHTYDSGFPGLTYMCYLAYDTKG